MCGGDGPPLFLPEQLRGQAKPQVLRALPLHYLSWRPRVPLPPFSVLFWACLRGADSVAVLFVSAETRIWCNFLCAIAISTTGVDLGRNSSLPDIPEHDDSGADKGGEKQQAQVVLGVGGGARRRSHSQLQTSLRLFAFGVVSPHSAVSRAFGAASSTLVIHLCSCLETYSRLHWSMHE